MPVIEITTIINAPVARCFDLARSIDFHTDSTQGTNEQAIAGVTKGLIGKGERVTWKAKHFGIVQTLTSEITEMDAPFFFEDVMVKGAFKSFRHQHFFEEQGEQTVMKDVFEFESPFGIFGRVFNTLVLTKHMIYFLKLRNGLLKQAAETDEWKKYLSQ